LLIQSEYFDFFDSILRSILILAIAETDGHDDVKQETPAETARKFLENLISGVKSADYVDSEKYKGISSDNKFYFDTEKSEENSLDTSLLNTWLHSVERDSIQESAVIGNKLNAYYCPELKRPLLNLCKEFPLWSGVMVIHFKCPNKIGSSARIKGYFADLKSTVIDKRKPRLRLDKFVVTHLRAIRGSMKIAKSDTKMNESMDLNESEDHATAVRTRGMNNVLKGKKYIERHVKSDELNTDNDDWIVNTIYNSKNEGNSRKKKLDTKNNKICKDSALKLEQDNIESDDDDLIWKPKKIKKTTVTKDDSEEEDIQMDKNELKKIEHFSDSDTDTNIMTFS